MKSNQPTKKELTLNVSTKDLIEEIVIKSIEYIKSLNRVLGLTDDEIKYKYCCGYCAFLTSQVSAVVKAVKGCYVSIEECECFCDNRGREDVSKLGIHYMIKLPGKKIADFIYYDINGRKEEKDLQLYLNHFVSIADFWAGGGDESKFVQQEKKLQQIFEAELDRVVANLKSETV